MWLPHQEGGKKLIFTLFPTYFSFSDFFLTYISYVFDLNKLMGHLQWGTHNHLAGGKISNLPCCWCHPELNEKVIELQPLCVGGMHGCPIGTMMVYVIEVWHTINVWWKCDLPEIPVVACDGSESDGDQLGIYSRNCNNAYGGNAYSWCCIGSRLKCCLVSVFLIENA